MSLETTAFIFIGYQNDYFSQDGILRSVIEEADRTGNILTNTLSLIQKIHLITPRKFQDPTFGFTIHNFGNKVFNSCVVF